MFFAPGLVHAEDGFRTTDYNKALAQAKVEKKMVLLNFTGSDWCEWCIRLDKEVFATPKFQNYAKKNLILVTVDFPEGKELPLAVRKQNEDLRDKFDVQVFPECVCAEPGWKKGGAGRIPARRRGCMSSSRSWRR